MLRHLVLSGLVVAPLLSAADWARRPSYPLEPGAAGIIAGTHGGVLIAAGGANFPEKMPWDGGKKVYYDEIFVITPGENVWRPAGKLPERRAYAACVSVANGVLALGGENAEGIFQDTLWLRWDGRKVVTEKGSAMPAPRTSQVAVELDGALFVAGGYAPGAVRVSTGDFWRLDLSRRDAAWQILGSWPGPTRAQGTIAALDGAVYLISGLEMTVDDQGKAKPNYLGDAYRFAAGKWERLPDPPWSAIASPTPAPVALQPGRIWVLGGIDRRLVGKTPRDTRVPDHIQYFDVEGHAWRTVEERWPDPVVTSPAVQMGGEWWIVSGEIMAGRRTTSVWSLRLGTAK